MRVAIVDDDPIVCSSLSTILKATGTADIAWTAYDGETAVGQYEEDNPDVLLIDVQMPVMDGLAASRKIIDAHPNAKILILTTFADESYIPRRPVALPHRRGVGNRHQRLPDQTGCLIGDSRSAVGDGRTGGYGSAGVAETACQ